MVKEVSSELAAFQRDTSKPIPNLNSVFQDEEQKQAAVAEYLLLHKNALTLLELDGEPDLELMLAKPYQDSLTSAHLVYEQKIMAEPYRIHNEYVRKAFQKLLPSELVLEHWNDNLIEQLKNLFKKKVIDQVKKNLSPLYQEGRKDDYTEMSIDPENIPAFNLTSKQQNEPASGGYRLPIPEFFYQELLAVLEDDSQENSFLDRFFHYHAALSLAAAEVINSYVKKHNQEVENGGPGSRLPDFLESMSFFDAVTNRDDIDTFTMHKIEAHEKGDAFQVLVQAIDNAPNYTDLLAVLLHADHKAKDAHIPLRQYFISEEGKTVVAKCGFLNVFMNHLQDILLVDTLELSKN